MAPSQENGIGLGSNNEIRYNERGWPIRNERGYETNEEHFGTRRPIRVIHLGAGVSGICFSKFVQDQSENVDLQIYEKDTDIGGTWLENRYPGCACDIPSAAYQFTWEPNPFWPEYYSESKHIWQYLKDIVEKYGLMKYIKLQHTITGAYWNSQQGLWEVGIQRPDGTTFVDTCNVFVNGGGGLNNWKWPDIEGLHSFKGSLTHSAHYDESLDLRGKRVAAIGIGSSGIQIISKIQPQVKQLYCWVRSPTWITPGFAQKFAGPTGGNFKYTTAQKEKFAKDPKLFLKYCKMIESELNVRFKFILNNTAESKTARKFAEEAMRKRLQGADPEVIEAIIPKTFNVGCRRPTPGEGFLEALTKENVKVYTKQVQQINATGFIDCEGCQVDVDVIICATGFNTSFIPRFPVEANGYSIAKLWEKVPESYIGLGVPHMPNYFMMGGPNGPSGHGSLFPILEILASNVLQCIDKMQRDRIESITPKTEAVREFKEHADLYLQRTAWTGPCSSVFKQGRVDGPLSMFPGSRLTYLELLSIPRFEDYDIIYCNKLNRWQFLGDGFAVREFDGRDLSYYMGLVDGEDRQIDLEGALEADLQDLIHQNRV
ncbi:hypothetical protein H2204_002588 [Knufia peltigerae]|uniref:Uncharacterized protein n=1 Tax=Knufia peltigerae TaxID=1002370 RepID=A0AA38YB12_9EURO|nr:hypothetical protein H2204_002588 [Knufia peltigerae]